MLQTLWFLIKLGLLLALTLWIASQPGQVSIEWQNYAAQIHLGFLLSLSFIAFLSALLLYRFILMLANIPSALSRKQAAAHQQKGYRALTLGMSALAAGDSKAAEYNAQRARKFLKDEHGLPCLIEAQAARQDGREADANKHFQELIQNKDAAFLGLRGLLQNALQDGNNREALKLAYRALDLHPKQKWILKTAYRLEIQAKNFEAARPLLKRCERAGACERGAAKKDVSAILIAEGDEAKKTGYLPKAEQKYKEAYKQDPSFVPAAQRLAEFYLDTLKRGRAVSTLEKTWKQNPHPDLAALWIRARPANLQEGDLKLLDWVQRLVKLNPDHAESYRSYALTAMRFKLLAEAREALLKSEAIEADSKTYRLLADVEMYTGNQTLAATYLEKAVEAPSPKRWICHETGLIYDRWNAFAEPHNAFNTIIWDTPSPVKIPDTILRTGAPEDLLEAV